MVLVETLDGLIEHNVKSVPEYKKENSFIKTLYTVVTIKQSIELIKVLREIAKLNLNRKIVLKMIKEHDKLEMGKEFITCKVTQETL